MILVAPVRRVAVRGIYKIAGYSAAGDWIGQDMPDPTHVELDIGDDGTCMIYSYGKDGVFCGDTWH